MAQPQKSAQIDKCPEHDRSPLGIGNSPRSFGHGAFKKPDELAEPRAPAVDDFVGADPIALAPFEFEGIECADVFAGALGQGRSLCVGMPPD